MVFLRSSVFHFALLIMFNSPAFAAIDDFSTGHYNIPSAGFPTVVEIQNCLSFCQGGSREVHLVAGGDVPASSLLLAPPGEAETFLADNAAISFFYRAGSGNFFDFVSGGTATQFEIWFTAFEPGGEVSVIIADDWNASETQTLAPSFATPPTPSQPGIVVFPFASFATVDLTRVKRISFTIFRINETGGIYSVTLFVAPGADAGTLTTSGELDTAGPSYPSVPKIDFEWEAIPPIGPPVGVMIGLEDVQDESGLQVGASVQAASGDTASFLATTLESVTSPTIQYRFDFESLETMSPTSINIMPVNWSAGQDYAEVIAYLGVDGGMWKWRLFMETSQPVSLSAVTAVPGSALVTVALSGDVDTGTPVLDMAMAGSFVSAPPVPTLDHPLALAMLAIALMATGIWLHRSRRALLFE